LGNDVLPVRAEVIIDFKLAATPVQQAGWFAELFGLKTQTTPGLALGHELLGHGMQVQLRTVSDPNRGDQADAVRYENRFLRSPRGIAERTTSGF
jgi:hypothetical protein